MLISSSLDTGFAVINFTDDGPGVSSDSLPICAKIIERSGGTIHAENGNTGGLAIVIRLPIEPIGSKETGTE